MGASHREILALLTDSLECNDPVELARRHPKFTQYTIERLLRVSVRARVELRFRMRTPPDDVTEFATRSPRITPSPGDDPHFWQELAVRRIEDPPN